MLSDTIIKGLPGIFYVARTDGKLIRWNKNLEIFSGYSSAELETMMTTDLLDEGQLEMIREKRKEAFSSGLASEKLIVVNKEKERFVYYVTIMPIRYNNENCMLGIGIDMTEQTEQEKQFSKAVTEAQELERMQISMEIHDNVKQIMAACLLNLDFVKMNITNRDLAAEGVTRVKKYLSESMDELRRISHQLAPSADSLDLEEKIEGLILTMNVANKLRFQYRFNSANKQIAEEIQLSIYRILQEHLSNIVKHANASMVNIDLKRENGDLYMSVRDNGRGFNPNLVKSGIGLENIRRRASILNGQISIISSPGSGCDLIVKIPVGHN
jgi:PAS domain S-box-containing protein